MASIFSLDKQVAKLPKHGFPMSMVFDFTSSCGHILPTYFDQLNPGEKFRYSCDLFTRTQPLSSPANVDIDEYIDVFFVPLKKLSAVADNILFQIEDVPSSFYIGANGSVYLATDYVLPLLDTSKLGYTNSSNPYLGQFNAVDPVLGNFGAFFDSFACGSVRLFDHLGYDPVLLLADQNYTHYSPKVPVAPFGVYQAIYYDYFRLSNWERNRVYAYNFDSAYQTLDILSSGSAWAISNNLRDLLQIHYRARQKDYFTNIYPSPMISSGSMLTGAISNLLSVNQWLVNGNLRAIQSDGTLNFFDPTTLTRDLTSTYNDNVSMRSISTASLRTMFAVDKLMKITARAGKHYDDQVLAHFGFKVPQGYSNEVVHLGTHHQKLHVGEVISTASTAQGNLGELAGKGYQRQSGQIVKSFTAPCHGFVMAVYSCEPTISYVGGLNRLNTNATRYDWFIPALDNLGMQPIFRYEASMDYQNAATAVQRYAWTIRNAQMKCKYNRATFAFVTRGSAASSGPFADWVITDEFPFMGNNYNIGELGHLLVNPCMLNQILLVGYDGFLSFNSIYDSVDNYFMPEVVYSRDPLIHHLVQTVSKVSGMSIYGLDDKAI